METYEFARGLDHASVLAASERVAWTVGGVIRDRRFDPSGPLVPSSWLGTRDLGFLDERDERVLGHCRAFSYVHLLGNFEEFAPPHLGGFVERDWHDDRAHLRSLLRFADEEMKHQQLLRRVELLLEASCGHSFGRHFDDDKVAVTALTTAVLQYAPLPRFLMVLALEWGTQRHYVESIRDHGDEAADSLYVDVLKAHWVEEAQHVKTDALEIAALARTMSAEALALAFDDVLALGALVDSAFAGQATKEIETLERVTGRTLAARDAALLHDALHRSLRRIFAEVGLSHPSFAKVARELSAAGAAKLGLA